MCNLIHRTRILVYSIVIPIIIKIMIVSSEESEIGKRCYLGNNSINRIRYFFAYNSTYLRITINSSESIPYTSLK